MTTESIKLDNDKIRAEIAHLMAQTAKLNKETQWYALFMASVLIGAIATVVKVFF